ncbi:acyltransferase [Pelagicoccus sp. SDUM812003]|uniref:acyltransferase family protein n=1 Tax=Pelagicoccus sp. SDUM812003 TaxID=3041267 RepID=UPI00280ECDC6|nr:acyltransferase [Pelagicoccus sp. SDUM812003]MDQ8204997.1 acyltransferase [Pelagicoccus sp. SDUM812003]
MGILRVYLAVCVVAAHSEKVLPWAMHSGREAVQIFFIVSGFYMQFVLASGKYGSVLSFYRSRILRIYVPYFLVLLCVVGMSFCWWGLGFGGWLTLSQTVDLREGVSFSSAFAAFTNFSLIFQDWVMFLESSPEGMLQFSQNFQNSEKPLWLYLWIPQAWSVGVELAFYALAPVLVSKLSWKRVALVALASLVLRVWFYSMTGLTNDPWSYRFFPFELSNFLLGMLGCRLMLSNPLYFRKLRKRSAAFCNYLGWCTIPYFGACLLLFLFGHTHLSSILHRSSVEHFDLLAWGAGQLLMALWVIIIPILFTLSRDLKWDRNLGELSYPVYLLHFTIALIVGAYCSRFNVPMLQGEFTTLTVLVLSYLLQRVFLQPFETWRQRVAGGYS